MYEREIKLASRKWLRERLFSAAPPVDSIYSNPLDWLPHRPPMALIDQVRGVDLAEGNIVGVRRFGVGDIGFEGHFPGKAVYPGVLQIEVMAQLALCFQVIKARAEGLVEFPSIRLLRVHHATFAGEIRPGMTVTVLARRIEDIGLSCVFAGQMLADERVLSTAIVEAAEIG